MSAAQGFHRDEPEATYAVDFSRDQEPMKARKRFPEYRRRGTGPARVAGMHCRRNKRWSWGSGRAARVLNLRAFAGVAAFALASVASSVFGITIDMRTIGNPSNAANSSGYGAVSYTFSLGTYETTNEQYVAFLNSVGKTNPNAIYDSRMGTDANGGIVQTGSSGNFSYQVKPGTNPLGRSYGQLPVNFVNWFSAARFVNWLHNGESSNPALLETGSYTLANATSGAIRARNPGATFVLPTVNEWMKAGYYNPTSATYTNFATNNNSSPAANVSNTTLANVANYGGQLGLVTAGSYSSSQSAYGLFEMMGNVSEMTETANPGNGAQWNAMSGSYSSSSLTAFSQSLGSGPSYVGSGTKSAAVGFRVGQIAAVPEPGTLALAGVGLAGLAGYGWVRRRKIAIAG